MTDARPWWRRRPILVASLALTLLGLAVVAVLGVRALLVVGSVDPRADYWDERAQQPGDVVHLALGDSLSQGIGSSSPATSFVSVLAGDLAERTGERVRVVNLSVTGATTAELVRDQLPRFVELLAELEADGVPVGLVTVCIGANDAGTTSPEDYRRDLRTVLDALPAGSYVTDVPDFNGGPRQEPAAALAVVAREEVAAREDLVLVPLEAATGDQSTEEYAADFFHPSDEGYRRYVEVFRATIEGTSR
ncbi:SGNH/GDSL hydrolase family protein [Aquipuribacter sp. MA13-6]|uniref:SGNH/GDSL hydrolase family protein n=1 Tax=unclassified Aquipuribacter TaxID=2635084 RepID=UPI003EEE1E39